MLQDGRGCLRMLAETALAALVLILTVLALVAVARMGAGNAEPETAPPSGTPSEVGYAIERALDANP